MKKNKIIYNLILLVILGGILVSIWIEYVDLSSFGENLRRIKALFALVALAIFAFSMVIKSLRWRYIINQISNISFKDCFWILVTGNLINYIIPLRLGELVKIGLLKKRAGMDYGSSLTTIFMDKLSDISLIVWVIILIPILQISLPTNVKVGLNIIAIVFMFALVFLVVALAFNKRILRSINTRGKKGWSRFFTDLLEKFIQAFKRLRLTPTKIIKIVLFSILIGLIDAFKVFILYLAFGYRIPILIAIFGALARYLFFAIPMPPGQIGSVELIWLSIYTGLYSIDANIVNSASVTAHTISLVCNITLGTIGMIIMGVNVREIFSKSKK